MAEMAAAATASPDLVSLWKTCSAALTQRDDKGSSVIDAWNIATDLLKPRGIDDGPQSLNPSQTEVDAVNALHAANLIPTLLEWHTGELCKFQSLLEAEKPRRRTSYYRREEYIGRRDRHVCCERRRCGPPHPSCNSLASLVAAILSFKSIPRNIVRNGSGDR